MLGQGPRGAAHPRAHSGPLWAGAAAPAPPEGHAGPDGPDTPPARRDAAHPADTTLLHRLGAGAETWNGESPVIGVILLVAIGAVFTVGLLMSLPWS